MRLPPFSLSWDAPMQCPGQAYVRSAVEQLLARGDAFPSHVDVRARVERCTGDSWCVRLTTVRDGETGERFVESSSCRSLADATALIVAVTIDPERAAEPPETVFPSASAVLVAPAPPAPPPATPTTPAKEAPAASGPGSAPFHVGIVAQASSDLGTMPQPAYGFTVGASLMFGAFRLDGYAAHWAAPTAPAGSGPLTSTNVQLTVGGIRGCLVPWRGVLEISGCSGLELGDLHSQASPAGVATQPIGIGEGIGGAPFTVITRSASTADSFWMSVTASARAFWRVTPSLGLALDIGLAFPLRRDAFAPAAGTLAQATWVAGRASIGPEARF